MGTIEKHEKLNGQTETRHIVIVAKLKIQSPVELAEDFEMFKLKWKRSASEALALVGEIKVVDIIT